MSVMAKRKPKTVPVYLRMQIRLKKAMQELAEDNRREFSEEVAIALEKHLAEVGRWPVDPKHDDED